LGFSARDAGVRTEEQQGIVEFRIIRNDKYEYDSIVT